METTEREGARQHGLDRREGRLKGKKGREIETGEGEIKVNGGDRG